MSLLRENKGTSLSVPPKKGRHVRPRRSINTTGIDNERRLSRRRPISSSLFATSTLPLLIVGLISVERCPLPSRAFQIQNHNIIHSNLEKRIQRIRTAADCDSTNGGRISRPKISNSHFPLDTRLCMGNDDKDKNDDVDVDDESNVFVDRILFDDIDEDLELSDKEFLKRQLNHLESMERMLDEIDDYCGIEGMCDDDDDEDEDISDETFMGDVDDLEDMESLFDFLEENVAEFGNADDGFKKKENDPKVTPSAINTTVATAVAAAAADASVDTTRRTSTFSPQGLEEALLQGVVPVDAGVGSNTLSGDFGFDPLGLAEKDYVQDFQFRFLNALPGGNPSQDPPPPPRPSALVLRDYREAEIRHGRLAMLAVIIWPIQEKVDQFFLEPNQRGPLLYGPVTLPYLPLFMTLLMMLLGYLDIYAKDIQEEEGVGDAFLPGDCFWDPLKVLDGAPPTMKKNMQERELFNGRVAMLAFAAFVFEEASSHEAVIDIPGNEVLFVPAYQIASVQEWLDSQFLTYDY